jgi:hypothetical protein
VQRTLFLSAGRTLEVFLIDQTLAFFNGQDLIHIRIANFVNYTTWPTNFYEVDLRSFFEAKMQPQVILGEIAATAPHFI